PLIFSTDRHVRSIQTAGRNLPAHIHGKSDRPARHEPHWREWSASCFRPECPCRLWQLPANPPSRSALLGSRKCPPAALHIALGCGSLLGSDSLIVANESPRFFLPWVVSSFALPFSLRDFYIDLFWFSLFRFRYGYNQ